MFSYLKSERLIILLIFLICLLYWVQTDFVKDTSPLTWELRQFLIGQKISEGFILYQDIIENIAPLSAYTFSFIHLLGIPLEGATYLGISLVLLQGFIFQSTIKRFDFFPNLGYFPFILLVSLFFISKETWTLSPSLLGLTFMLLAWSEIIYQQRGLTANDRVFLIGIYIGIGSLFFLSYTFFVFWGLYALIGYTGVNLRQILLYLVGFLLPFFSFLTWLNYTENLGSLWNVFQESAFQFNWKNTENFTHIFITYLPGILVMLLGLYKLSTSGKIRANAQKAQQTNFGWLLISLLFLYTIPNYSKANLVVFNPAFCFLGLQIFALNKSKLYNELLFWTIALCIFITHSVEKKNDQLSYLPKPKLAIRNEKLLVLGPQLEEYLSNKMSGPFVNWELSKFLFKDLNNYENVILLTNLFEKDPPTYIYDPELTFKNLQTKIPNIGLKYRESSRNLYTLIP